MKLRKSRLNLAVGAVLGAAALIPATTFGWSVFTPNAAPNLLSASGGDTLLFPVYSTVTTVDPAGDPVPVTTSFSTTNTGDRTILAKIRFREQSKSMDVLDFLVVYSPYDKFDFSVSQPVGGVRPTMSWKDTTCLVGPVTGADGVGSVQFPPKSPFVADDALMSVGHLEVLGMADVTDVWTSGTTVVAANTAGAISWAAAAKHGADGKPANCQVFTAWLASQKNVATLNAGIDGTTPVLLDVDNVLTGRFVITGVGQGIEAGSDAIGIRDSDLTGTDPVTISAQSNSECGANGTANCISTYAWDLREWDHPHLGEMANLANYQQGLTAANVAGDWSNNPANFVGVDWILSFPNKYAYLDLVDGAECAGGAGAGTKEWCLLYETRTGNGTPGVWTAAQTTPMVGSANLCLPDNQLDAWDREEQQASATVNVSPGGRDTLDLCEELEIFTLAPEGVEPRPSTIQVPERRRVVSFTNLESIWGWAKLTVSWPLNIAQGAVDLGDSVTGLIWTSRNTENVDVNNASLTDLQKCVGCPDPL